jgi:hypothetical protein
MSKQSALSAAALLLAATACQAQEAESYRFEARVTRVNQYQNGALAGGQTQPSLTCYVRPIRADSSLPFAELEFLQSVSWVSVSHSPNEPKTHFSGMLYLDQLAMGLEYGASTQTQSGFSVDSSMNRWTLGYRVRPDWMLSVVRKAQKTSVDAGFAANSSPMSNTQTSLAAHGVVAIEEGRSLVFDLEMKRDESSAGLMGSSAFNETSGQLRFYPKPRVYVEAGLTFARGNSWNEGRTLSYGGGLTLNRRLILQLSGSSFTQTGAPNAGNSYRTLGLGLGARF